VRAPARPAGHSTGEASNGAFAPGDDTQPSSGMAKSWPGSGALMPWGYEASTALACRLYAASLIRTHWPIVFVRWT